MRFLIRLWITLSALWATSVFGYVALTGNKGGADQWEVAALTAFGTPLTGLVVLLLIAEARRDVEDHGVKDSSPSSPPSGHFQLSIPESVRMDAINDVGVFFEGISGTDRNVVVEDHLDYTKSYKRAELLERYAPIRGQKLLEIGSGYGTNLATWIKEYSVDGYGVEPGSWGFDASFKASKVLFQANSLDPARIVDGTGEALPFQDETFDIVYSANVLEHTIDPLKVLTEAVRVTKPGGTIHMEIPNYLSYFEGHYMLPMPPMWSNRFLSSWVGLFGRDPSFARTLRLINPGWCRRAVRDVGKKYPVERVSLGSDLFLERLGTKFEFEMQATKGQIGSLVRIVQYINFGNWIGHLIVLAQGYYPIFLTLRRL